MKIDPKELKNLQDLVDSDQWHALIKKCLNLLGLYPTSSIIWNMFGLGHLQAGNIAGAKMAFEEAMVLDQILRQLTLIMEMHAVNSAN